MFSRLLGIGGLLILCLGVAEAQAAESRLDPRIRYARSVRHRPSQRIGSGSTGAPVRVEDIRIGEQDRLSNERLAGRKYLAAERERIRRERVLADEGMALGATRRPTTVQTVTGVRNTAVRKRKTVRFLFQQ